MCTCSDDEQMSDWFLKIIKLKVLDTKENISSWERYANQYKKRLNLDHFDYSYHLLCLYNWVMSRGRKEAAEPCKVRKYVSVKRLLLPLLSSTHFCPQFPELHVQWTLGWNQPVLPYSVCSVFENKW